MTTTTDLPIERIGFALSRRDCTSTIAQGVLLPELLRMGPDLPRLVIELDQDNQYTVWYDQEGATGDDGRPVRGDVTGHYEVAASKVGDDWLIGTTVFFRQHVSPHGASGYGNPEAKRYAAERVAEAIARHHARSGR